ncbi:KilA-N domain-containing protein [Aureispira sp. CCB-QB1]|uniref:KilA-N domain-containing protein n=1 Tax=Aureispira sp. CCB-QB1 TaxID=1313421 RepID=UPI000697F804|nr:KilA-N domain-containing protein [Aureispira sp. CCB-QB1]
MAKKKTSLTVQGTKIRLYQEKAEDFISLTDIAKKFNPRTGQLILNWLRTRSTISFLGAWETIHNENFNVLKFEYIKNQTGDPTFTLSVSDWMEQTEAIGIKAKTGRYGGTYAHKDIAFEFLSYLSPTFKLYVFQEFQRLKTLEIEEAKLELDWNLKRVLSKVNYTVHTDAIKEKLIPPRITKGQGFIYAGEADILNVAVFGMTAKMWRHQNPKLKGNIRDYASTEQLVVLLNLEAVNAELIRMQLSQDERAEILNQAAIKQMQSLLTSPSLPKVPKNTKNLPKK